MKIRIILSNSGHETDRQTIDITDADATSNYEIGTAIVSALEAWTLAPGDTIKIVEVS
jgi:hypothetical protein